MNNLSGLIDRLENATSRLENLASLPEVRERVTREDSIQDNRNEHRKAFSTNTKSRAYDQNSSSRLEANYDGLVRGSLTPFLKLSTELSGIINKQVLALSHAFEALEHFLHLTTISKKPESSSKVYFEILKDLQREIAAVNEIREAHRSSPLIDHLSMIGEGAGALGWITIEPNPADYAAEFMNGAKLYGNRILKQYREKDSTSTQWVQAFYTLCQSLVKYININHPKGISWNSDGLDPTEAINQIKGIYPFPKTDDAVPPPPPLPTVRTLPKNQEVSAGASMTDVFKEINQGENIITTLKKADKRPERLKDEVKPESSKSQMDSKPQGSETNAKSKSDKASNFSKGTSKHILDGNRWIIEGFNCPKQPILISPDIRHSILISHCQDVSIIVSGKATAVSVDNCSKLKLRLDSLVASFEAIKVNNLSLEISGTVSSILLDQIDIGNVVVGKNSENIEIYTSKISGVNVDYEYAANEISYSSKEFLIPEQMKSSLKDGKLKTEVVEYLE